MKDVKHFSSCTRKEIAKKYGVEEEDIPSLEEVIEVLVEEDSCFSDLERDLYNKYKIEPALYEGAEYEAYEYEGVKYPAGKLDEAFIVWFKDDDVIFYDHLHGEFGIGCITPDNNVYYTGTYGALACCIRVIRKKMNGEISIN